MMTLAEMAFGLIAGHAIADFSLQTQWLSAAKNHTNAFKEDGVQIWPVALSAHGIVHGALVAIVTGSVLLGVLESISHVVIDYLKSDNKFGFYTDQFLHLLCKAIWLGFFNLGLN